MYIMANGWKITAIIFIILFIAETAFVTWAVIEATENIDKEMQCIVNICDGYESYNFDEYDDICYCFNDNKLEYFEYVK